MQKLSPASEASREVANLIERKNTPVYGVKEFVHLSVLNFDPNDLRTGVTEWAKKYIWLYLLSIINVSIPKNKCFLKKW